MLYPFFRPCRPARSPASCGLALRRKRGFNLIESAIVLGVVGLVIGGVWSTVSALQTARLANQTLDGVLQAALIVLPIYTTRVLEQEWETTHMNLVESQPAFVSLVEGKLDGFGPPILIPPSSHRWLKSPLGTLTGGTAPSILRITSGAWGTKYLQLELTEVPKAICKRIVQRLKGLMTQDPSGRFYHVITSGATDGSGEAYFSVPNTVVSGANFRFDSNYCLTGSSIFRFNFRSWPM